MIFIMQRLMPKTKYTALKIEADNVKTANLIFRVLTPFDAGRKVRSVATPFNLIDAQTLTKRLADYHGKFNQSITEAERSALEFVR